MKVTFGSLCVAATSAAFALGSVGRVFAQAPAPSAAPEVTESASAVPVAPEPAPPAPADSSAPVDTKELAISCKKGSVLVHGACVPSDRAFSRKKDVCDPPCAAGKVCRGPNRCGPPERGTYLHDGVYFRFGAGVGIGSVSKKADGFERESGVGPAPVFEVALGGAPTPGFVFGVGVYGARVVDPAGSAGTFGYATLVGTGPFVDVYPLPRENFHVQAALTYNSLWLSSDQVDPSPSYYCPSPCTKRKIDFDGSGLGLMWGIGFEGWTSSQVSAGILFRFQYFSTTLVADNAPFPNATASVFVPALLLTLTAQ